MRLHVSIAPNACSLTSLNPVVSLRWIEEVELTLDTPHDVDVPVDLARGAVTRCRMAVHPTAAVRRLTERQERMVHPNFGRKTRRMRRADIRRFVPRRQSPPQIVRNEERVKGV